MTEPTVCQRRGHHSQYQNSRVGGPFWRRRESYECEDCGHVGPLDDFMRPPRVIGLGAKDIAEMGVVQPGDRLLVRLNRHVTESAIERVREGLRECLPDVEVIYIGGPVEQILLVRDQPASGGVAKSPPVFDEADPPGLAFPPPEVAR